EIASLAKYEPGITELAEAAKEAAQIGAAIETSAHHHAGTNSGSVASSTNKGMPSVPPMSRSPSRLMARKVRTNQVANDNQPRGIAYALLEGRVGLQATYSSRFSGASHRRRDGTDRSAGVPIANRPRWANSPN